MLVGIVVAEDHTGQPESIPAEPDNQPVTIEEGEIADRLQVRTEHKNTHLN